jgi:hypothetical protein
MKTGIKSFTFRSMVYIMAILAFVSINLILAASLVSPDPCSFKSYINLSRARTITNQ